MKKHLALLILLISFIGCAQPKPDGDTVLLDVPFEKQKEWYCGAAAVSEIFRFYNDFITQDAVASRLFSRKRGGILNIDLTLFLRNRKYFTKTLTIGDYLTEKEKNKEIRILVDKVKSFIDSGHPVIALIGPDVRDFFGFKVRIFIGPLFYISDYEDLVRYNHYIVLTGYNETKKEFYCHDGLKPNVTISFDEFLKRWQATGFWALVAVPPDRTRWDLSAEEFLDTGVLLERLGEYNKALDAYDSAIASAGEQKKDLTSNIMFNKANVYISMKEFEKAEDILLKLKQTGYQKGPVLNNLAEILSQKGEKLDTAEGMVLEAIRIDRRNLIYYTDTLAMLLLKKGNLNKSEELLKKIAGKSASDQINAVLWHHLGKVYRAAGKNREAFSAFERALELTDEDDEPEKESEYALDYSVCGIDIGERVKAENNLHKVIALDRGEKGWEAKELLKKLHINKNISPETDG